MREGQQRYVVSDTAGFVQEVAKNETFHYFLFSLTLQAIVYLHTTKIFVSCSIYSDDVIDSESTLIRWQSQIQH